MLNLNTSRPVLNFSLCVFVCAWVCVFQKVQLEICLAYLKRDCLNKMSVRKYYLFVISCLCTDCAKGYGLDVLLVYHKFICASFFNPYLTLGKFSRWQIDGIFLIFPRKQDVTFHAYCLLRKKWKKVFQNVFQSVISAENCLQHAKR